MVTQDQCLRGPVCVPGVSPGELQIMDNLEKGQSGKGTLLSFWATVIHQVQNISALYKLINVK